MVRLLLLQILAIVGTAISTGTVNRADLLDVIRRIDLHNQNQAKTFHLRFSDVSMLTPAEYNVRLGLRMPAVMPESTRFVLPDGFKAPDSVDWREKGAVTRVKDQGQCSSDWAFSAVGALEGQHVIKGKKPLLELSEQNIIDCADAKYAGFGCHGGYSISAFVYIGVNGGVDTEESYPYAGKQGACQFNNATVGETVHGYTNTWSGSEEDLMNMVAAVGPVSVGIDAHPFSFHHYGGGVYVEKECTQHHLNHAVLVVGYGTDPEGGDYWLVKNSWNTTWGEQGYIRMARNRNNQCGIASFVTYPII